MSDDDSCSNHCGPSLYRELLGSDIRLLTIHAGEDDEEIECELEQLALDTKPEYYALSYVWGDQYKRRPILVNRQRFDVTANLYDALHHLRQQYVRWDSAFSIWIDAICINQEDIDEKSRQVTRMTDIYILSRQVIIWLGANDEQSDQSIKLLFEMASVKVSTPSMTSEAFLETSSSSEEEDQIPDDVWSDDDDQIPDGKLVAHIALLGARPWFSRIWTVQEACLGVQDPILWAGRYCVAMEDLVNLFLRLVDLHEDYVLPCFNVLGLARIRQLLRHADTVREGRRTELRDTSTSVAEFFVDLLCSLWGNRATEPLDQLYGFLGLVGAA